MKYSVESIPVEWIEKKLIEYVCSGKYSSSNIPVVYSIISDWRKEYEENKRNENPSDPSEK